MRKKAVKSIRPAAVQEIRQTAEPTEPPLVFISHDSRDADLAEAFSKLLKSVSAGMLKSFRSSDKTGSEGIEFGDEWYKTLMLQLGRASDVVCLLTERSLDRPWLLYEAGVAKGKLNTPVHGVALGVALSRVSVGPFFQFQNSDDTEESLTKLVLQLCRRVTGLDPDESVVKGQVSEFRKAAIAVLKDTGRKAPEQQVASTEASIAKVMEEMKLIVRELPVRLEQRMLEGPERIRSRRLSFRRFHPEMIAEMSRAISRETGDPIGLLILASFFREDMPWLYEIGVETYRTARGRNPQATRQALRTFRDAVEFSVRGPWSDDFMMGSKDTFMMLHELPRLIEYVTDSVLPQPPKKLPPAKGEKKTAE